MGAASKERLDRLVVERGGAETRERAQALVRAGRVRVGGRVRDKPGERVPTDAAIEVNAERPWASRGAHKLLGALEAFPWLRERIPGARCLDVGASTGGFTDVLLHHEAAAVAALDVGYGQLDWRLRSDERVVVLERTNVRHLEPGTLPWAPSLVVCDVSFIGLGAILGVLAREAAPGAVLVLLVKPQFEVGRSRVGRGGVVRAEADRADALEGVRAEARALGLRPLGACDASVAGPRGNREILLLVERPGRAEPGESGRSGPPSPEPLGPSVDTEPERS